MAVFLKIGMDFSKIGPLWLGRRTWLALSVNMIQTAYLFWIFFHQEKSDCDRATQ